MYRIKISGNFLIIINNEDQSEFARHPLKDCDYEQFDDLTINPLYRFTGIIKSFGTKDVTKTEFRFNELLDNVGTAFSSVSVLNILLDENLGKSSAGTSAVTTGWATYRDTTRVDFASSQLILADTDTILINNALSKIESQKPSYITSYYDGATNTILGRNGDALDIMIYFKAVPSSPSQYLDIWIDIGGSIGELYRQTFSFPKGSGTERGILYGLPSAYTLGTWEANGGTVYIRSNANINIHSINYNFDTTHKAI